MTNIENFPDFLSGVLEFFTGPVTFLPGISGGPNNLRKDCWKIRIFTSSVIILFYYQLSAFYHDTFVSGVYTTVNTNFNFSTFLIGDIISGVTISKIVHSLLLLSLCQGTCVFNGYSSLITFLSYGQKKILKSNEMEQFYPRFCVGGVTGEDISDSTVKSGEVNILIDGTVVSGRAG